MSSVVISGDTSGSITLAAPSVAGSNVLTLPTATSTLSVLGTAQTYTAPQRGTITNNGASLSFNMNTTDNFSVTPTATGALTFTNITAGQSGYILLVNSSNYAITAGSGTKVTSSLLATISTTGTYLISYFSDGTNVYLTASGALA